MDAYEAKEEEPESIEIESLLDGCAQLEKTVANWIEDNATKRSELKRLQKDVVQVAQQCLGHLSDEECKLRTSFEGLVLEKQELEVEVKQFSDINYKLSSLVTIAQDTCHEKSDADGKNDDFYLYAADTIKEYEQISEDFARTSNGLDELNKSIEKETSESIELLELNQQLVLDVNKNAEIIKLLGQQNKYAEQQFELILNELPWKPLSDDYLKYLTESSIPMLRDMGQNLMIQTSEITDLTESLNNKKERKLKFLEDLALGLELFMRRRGEANLITRFSPE